MSTSQRTTVTTAKSVSEVEVSFVKPANLFVPDEKYSSWPDEQQRKKLKSPPPEFPYKKEKFYKSEKPFRCSDFIMKFSGFNNSKTKSSLLKSSDTIYSLLCATYLTYASNKEKLVSATEILDEVYKEHNRLETFVKDKRGILRNYKIQQNQMKNEKSWFKSKITEYNEQSALLQERESKLKVKKDLLTDEFQCDKAKLDQLADELGTYLNYKAIQFTTTQSPSGTENESQDENELKALLTDVTDSDGTRKETKVKEVAIMEPQKEPVEQSDPVTHLPPKTPKGKSKSKSKGKKKTKYPESEIQSLICEDLMTLQGVSDDDSLFNPLTEANKTDCKVIRPSCSGVTIVTTSESTTSWFHPGQQKNEDPCKCFVKQ